VAPVRRRDSSRDKTELAIFFETLASKGKVNTF